MKTEPQIPRQLFLVAGKDVEKALQQATFEAFQDWCKRPRRIATWEDERVVFLPDWRASVSRQEEDSAASSHADVEEKLKSRQRKLFLDSVLNSAHKIYIKDEELHIEFTSQQHKFFAALENSHILTDICRDIAGRKMVVRMVLLKADQTIGSTVDHDSIWPWTRYMRMLGISRETLERMREWTLFPNRELPSRLRQSPPVGSRVSGNFPVKDDDLTSRKGD